MKKQKSNFLLKIIIFFLAAFFVAGFLSIQPLINKSTNPEYTMIDGKCSFNGKDRQVLFGNWELYLDKLIVTDNLNEASLKDVQYSEIPIDWSNNDLSDENYGSSYASYRAYVSNIPIGSSISIAIDKLSCAYSIYINRQKIVQNGVIEKKGRIYTASSIPNDPTSYQLYKVMDDKPIEIVIEVVSNTNKGLYRCPTLFIDSKLKFFNYQKIIQNCMMIGIFFIATLMHFFHFVTTKDKNNTILPTAFCFLLMMYSILSGSIQTFLAENMNVFSAEKVDIVILIFTLIICAIGCFDLFDNKQKFRGIIGLILCLTSTVILLLSKFTNIFYNTIIDNIALAIRPLLLSIAVLFLFGDREKSESILFSKASVVAIIIVDFLKSVYTSCAFYESTRYLETIFVAIAILLSLIGYFKEAKKTNKILWENKKLTEDNTQFKINLLLNQIKPHFLYNTLNSINSLCKIDPNAASNAIVSFSNYLRNNMESISDSNMITVSKELEHVKCYVDIEQIRFRERLRVNYDIKLYDFLVPPLSIQAITENAIKHGLSSMINGVSITIKTYDDKDYNYIAIMDDGVGFDINSIAESDSVGLRNICRRIEMLCKGELILKSRVGKGTTIILKLKK